jgi:ribosomal protein S18 acetylase RimI-like enzyme
MIDCAVFREIHSDDMPEIFDVRVAAWHNDRGREEMTSLGITHQSVREMMNHTHRGWLCEIDSRVVGFSMGNRQNGEMWVIAVLKEYEGNGIGRRLLRLVEDWLFSEGWDELWLTTDRDETLRAVGFYRHLGWVDWKVEPDGDRFMKRHKSTHQEDTPC